jgi:hypothetical protein
MGTPVEPRGHSFGGVDVETVFVATAHLVVAEQVAATVRERG